MKHILRIVVVLFILPLLLQAQPDNSWRQLGMQGLLGTHVQGFAQAKGGDMFLLSRQTVYRSTTMGASWFKSNKSLPAHKDSLFCIATNRSGDLFVGSANGFYRSIDTGNTWQRKNKGLEGYAVQSFFMDTTGIIFAGVYGLIFRSTDNGDTWAEVGQEIPTEFKKGVPIIHYSYQDGIVVTFGSWKYNSLTLGLSWKQLTPSGADKRYGIKYEYYDVYSTNLAGVSVLNEWSVGAKKYAEDGVFAGLGNLTFHQSRVMNSYVNELYSEYCGFGFIGKDSLLFGSYDHGIHKVSVCKFCNNDTNYYMGRFVNKGLGNLSITCFFKAANGWFFCGTRGGGAYYSTNNGESWNESIAGLTEPTVYNLLLPPEGDSVYYAATASGVYISMDSARSWQRRSEGLGNVLVYCLTFSKSGALVAGTLNGIYRSTDKGIHWQNTASPKSYFPKERDSPTPYMAVSDFIVLNNGHIVCSTTGGLLYRSTDDGKTWVERATPFSDFHYKNEMAELAYDANKSTIYGVANHFVLATRDTGASWTEYFLGGGTTTGMTLGKGSAKNTYFAVGGVNISYQNLSIVPPLISPINGDLPKGTNEINVQSIRTDPFNHLMIGTMGKGAYYSTNNGDNWLSFNKGLYEKDILHLVQDKEFNLYACTANNGIYISEKPTAWLDAPILVSPAIDSTNLSATVAFTWQSVVNALQYQIQVSEDSLCTTKVIDESGVAQTVRSIKLSGVKKYYWRVRGLRDELLGKWSEIRAFSTSAVLADKPELQYPPKDTTLSVSTTPLLWKSAARADSYTLQLANDSSFATLLLNTQGISILNVASPTLASNQHYYWRVRGVNSNGEGEWSDVWTFNTSDITSVEDETSTWVHLIPQPAGETLDIMGIEKGVEERDVQVVIADMQGRILLSTEATHINISGLTDGVYTCRINVRGKVHCLCFSVLR